jgi:hypothetical protein
MSPWYVATGKEEPVKAEITEKRRSRMEYSELISGSLFESTAAEAGQREQQRD